MGREIMDMPAPAAGHRIFYGTAEDQFGDLRLPEGAGPHPIVISIHGGFWRVARSLLYMGHLCEALRGAGVATWNVEYRRAGQRGGGCPGTLEDIAAASAHVVELARTFPIDTARAVAVGHSAGGFLALWLAASTRGVPLARVVSLGGVADLRRAWELNVGDGAVAEFVGGVPEDRYVRCGTPQWLVHGEQDDVVPIEIAECYLEKAVAAGDDCRLLRLPRAGHFELVDPRSDEWCEVLRVLK